jgi:hypothetical protein
VRGHRRNPRSPRQFTTKDVRKVPAEPHEMVIGQRPCVVFVPTIHVQDTRPLVGRLGVSPRA